MKAPYLRPASLGLVALGGTFGAAAREVLVLSVPGHGHLPWAIIMANLVGAFLLGLLYEGLAGGSAPVSPARSHRKARLRLLLGTGFCGGFTTYSTLSVGVALLAGTGSSGWAAGYAAGTVVVGAAATWAGIAAGTLRQRGGGLQ
ncbi:MAG: CrcB family protein [Specibacter sp.]